MEFNWPQIEPDVIALREQLSCITDAVIKTATADGMEVPATMKIAASQVKRTDYDVVVCGEVKKGKSSFINAIIGTDLLPTDTNVATSQVFKIANSESPKFELVFSDGSKTEINREELSKYGSQVEADIAGNPMFQDKNLEYIQIHYPVKFLPDGVNLVDTPGLGAIYEAHEQITNNYVGKAAAVVFILDPSNPVTRQEKEFIEKIYGITNDILFVMTKRDNYDESYIQDILNRDEEILNEAFGKNSSSPIRIHAISSKILSNAGRQTSEKLENILLAKSHFDIVRQQLLALIYTTVGVTRARYAYSESDKMIVKSLSLLSNRERILSSEGREVYDNLSAKRKQLYDDFNNHWGPNSQNYLVLNNRIDACIIGMENSLRSLFSSANPSYQKRIKEIDALESIREVNNYGASYLDSFAREISRSWDTIVENAQVEISSLISAYHSEMDLNVTKAIGTFSGLETKQLSFNEAFSCIQQSFFKVAFLGVALYGILGISLAPLSIIGIGLISIFAGKAMKERTISEAKSRYKQELANALTKMQSKCCTEPYENYGFSPLQKVVRDMRENASNAKRAMFEEIKKQIESDAETLKADMEKDIQQRKKSLSVLTEQKKVWTELQESLSASGNLLVSINTDINKCFKING